MAKTEAKKNADRKFNEKTYTQINIKLRNEDAAELNDVIQKHEVSRADVLKEGIKSFKKSGIDFCKKCKSEDLHDTVNDKNEFITVCNDCGKTQ